MTDTSEPPCAPTTMRSLLEVSGFTCEKLVFDGAWSEKSRSYLRVVITLSKVVKDRLIGSKAMFTLALFVRTAKKCAFDSSLSEEAFLNAILEPYVEAGHVRRRKGEPFALDKSRTSKILNGRCDVPVELRKALVRYGIEEAAADRFGMVFDDLLDIALFPAFSEEVLGSMGGSDAVEEELKKGLIEAVENPNLFMARALMGAIRADNRALTRTCLWSSGKASVHLEIGDIFAHGFGRPRKSKEIVVIPVNTTFDTKISWMYEGDPCPLVSERTIHGQWLKRMVESGISPAELNRRIELSIRGQGIEPAAGCGLGTSRKPEYPIGTVAVIENSRAVFYLVAISRFDKNNNARSSADLLIEAIKKMLELYDRRGQGLDLCLPLMGTGMSRTVLLAENPGERNELMDHQQSYDLIINALAEWRTLIHGKVTVVVHGDDKDKLKLPIQ